MKLLWSDNNGFIIKLQKQTQGYSIFSAFKFFLEKANHGITVSQISVTNCVTNTNCY